MSYKSEKVKRWRQRMKERIVAAMGGKCVICGYDRYAGALNCHHIDPETKSFSISEIRANPVSWEKIVEELKKCVLLCANCHCEHHAGLVSIPENAVGFNESYSVYDKL